MPLSPAELVQAFVKAHVNHAMAAWEAKPRTLEDPVVVVADSLDECGRFFTDDVRFGVVVRVASAAYVASIVPVLAPLLRKADTRSVYAVGLAHGHTACAYLVRGDEPGAVMISTRPGACPLALTVG